MTSTTTVKSGRRIFVIQLNGHQLEVLHKDEKAFFEQQLRSYRDQFSFTVVSDLTDLDRLLVLELQAFRYNRWLTSGRDYDDFDLPDARMDDLRGAMKQLARDISAIKSDLGMSKAMRDREQHESVGGYIVELRRRALEHGIRRNKQVDRFIGLMMELRSLVGTFDRSNELEREKIGLTSEADLVEWVRSYMIPEFDAIDAEYRQTSQRLWVGRL